MIVTFYSFKGGVGRSMAMSAAGYLLAQRGLKVLVIDFDLEAPGLERYFFDEPSSLATVRSNQGLIDFVLAYKRALTSEEEFKRADFKDWSRYIVDAIPRTPSGGSVDLMTAGCRYPQERYADYALFVRNFAWQDFFQNWRGDRFFDWLRRELTAGPHSYDVVLVDSRTGVTEMGGVCAYQLADAAVLLCAPNYQNLDGTRAVLDDFRSDAVTALRNGRPLEIVVVPARVESSDTAKRDQFFADLERTFGSDGLPKILADAGLDYRRLAVPYDPALAIIERLVDETTIRDGPLASHSAARAAFERLTDVVLLLGGSNGERWETRRQEAFARLKAGDASPRSLPIADLSKRGSGYDAFFFAGAEDKQDATSVSLGLLAGNLNVWNVIDVPADKEDLDTVIGRVLQYSEVVLVGLGRSRPNDFLWALLRRARERRKPVVPVLLPGCTDVPSALQQHGFAAESAIDGRELSSHPQSLEQLIEAVSRRDRAAAPRPETIADPYPGADAFSEDRSPYFHGRDADADRLLSAVLDSHIVLLSGAASIGKTSLVHAGLLPRLRAHGADPANADESWSVVLTDMTGGDPDTALERVAAVGSDRSLLIVIDGIDETGDDVSPEIRARRVARLAEILRTADARRRFLLIWRGTWPADERNRARDTWFDRRKPLEVVLEPMDAAGVRAAIEKPVAQAGHLFEPGLVDRLVQDAGTQPGAIAQIQRALQELWAGRRRGWLTNKAYDTGNGLAGRFGQRLDKFLETLDPNSRFAAEVLLRALIEFDSRLGVVPVHRSWMSIASVPVLQQHDRIALRERLLRERLIDLWIADPTPSISGSDRGWTCALAQPAVPATVAALAHADPRFLLWRQRFSSYVYGYLQSGRPESYTVPSDALNEAEEWWAARKDELSADEQAVIESSMRARLQQQDAERKREVERLETARVIEERDRADAERHKAIAAARRSRQRSVVIGVLALVALGLGAFVLREAKRLQRQLAAESFHQAAEHLEANEVASSLAFLGQTLRLDPDHTAARSLTLNLLLNGRWPRQTIATRRPVRELAWSSDGGRLLAASDGGTWLWNPATGATTAELRAGEGIPIASWSPNGTRFITNAGNTAIQLWDAGTGKPIGQPFQHEATITARAWTADSQLLATGSQDRSVRVWDARGGTGARVRFQHPEAVTAIAWAPSGDRLATASADGRIRVWMLPGPDVMTLADLPAPIRALAWTGDGTLLAGVCTDGTALAWDPRADSTVKPVEFLQPGGPVTAVEWNAAAGMFATGLRNGAVFVWQPDREPAVLANAAAQRMEDSVPEPQPEPPVAAVAWSPSGVQLAVAAGDSIRVLQTRTWQPLGDTLRHQSDVTALAWTRDGRLLASADGEAARVWDAGLTRPAATLLLHEGNVVDASWNPRQARAISGSFDGTARIWDTNTGDQLAVLPHEASLLAVAWSRDGTRALTASTDGVVRIWDPDRKTPVVTIAHGAALTAVAWSVDEQRIATAGDDLAVRIWHTGKPNAAAAELKHGAIVSALAWNPDGMRLATGSEDRVARIWDLSKSPAQTSAELREDGSVVALEWDRTGNRLAIGTTGKNVHIWRSGESHEQAARMLLEHGAEVRALAWSPTGAWLATGSADHYARVWNPDRGKTVGAPMKHDAAVWDVQWNRDERRLATASWDSTARVWEPFTGAPASVRLLHRGNVVVGHWSSDGERLLTGSSDHSVRVWDVPAASPDAAERLAEMAELLGGVRVEFEEGIDPSQKKVPTLVPAAPLSQRIERMRALSAEASTRTSSPFDRLLGWFLADPYSRTISPMSTAAVPAYAARLKKAGDDGLEELFASFPAFGQ